MANLVKQQQNKPGFNAGELFSSISSMFVDKNSRSSGVITTQMSESDIALAKRMGGVLSEGMPPIQANGPGEAIAPDQIDYRGHYVDGSMIRAAENADLEITPSMAAQSRIWGDHMEECEQNAEVYYDGLERGGNAMSKVQRLHAQSTANTVRRHFFQWANNVSLSQTARRTAWGYVGVTGANQLERHKEVQREQQGFYSFMQNIQSSKSRI